MTDEFDWLDDLPLAAGPPDLRMGTRALDISTWLAADARTASELELRAELIAEHPEFVQIRPGHETALTELSSLVEIHIGDRIRTDIVDPLETLALSVPDDVLLMARNPDESNPMWRLVGGALLFPNQWTLEDKIDKDVTHIHDPVDGYDELLAARVERFFDRLSPARPVGRRNWFFHDDPHFFQPERMRQRPIADPDEAGELWVRSEWQTLRRLAFSEMIVFTVKTQVAPISALAERRRVAEQMVTFLEAASGRSLENKDAATREAAIIEYLRRAG